MPDRVLAQLRSIDGAYREVEIPFPLPGVVATPGAGSPIGDWGRDWARNGPQEIGVAVRVFVRGEDGGGVPTYREQPAPAPRPGVAYIGQICDECGQRRDYYFGERGETSRCFECYRSAMQRSG